MKESKGIQLSALLVAMLLIGMAFVPAVGAQAAQIDCPCSQGTDIADNSGVKVEATELSGVNRNKAMAQALSDKGVLKLREELIKSGYAPSIEKISAMKFAMVNESGGTITSTLVAMPFSGKDENETAVISFVYSEFGSTAAAVVVSNGMLTTWSYDSISGTVQIQKSEFWSCISECVCDAEPATCILILSGCLGACGSCIAVPNPGTCVVCAGCLLAYHYCVWDCLKNWDTLNTV